jgi:hypothetical protein
MAGLGLMLNPAIFYKFNDHDSKEGTLLSQNQ